MTGAAHPAVYGLPNFLLNAVIGPVPPVSRPSAAVAGRFDYLSYHYAHPVPPVGYLSAIVAAQHILRVGLIASGEAVSHVRL